MSFFTNRGEDDGIPVKELLTIPLKPRHDSLTDRYNRIFMVKLLFLSAIFMAFVWYEDDLQCVMPDNQASSEESMKFMGPACWIQGLYVYSELKDRVDQTAYYGIPKDIDQDGLTQSGYPCRTSDKFYQQSNACKPMTKTYYLQHQWLPFFVASLCVLYYVPYVLFRKWNHDLVNLKNDVIKDAPASKICLAYFQIHTKSLIATLLHVFRNLLLKLFNLLANVIAFTVTNNFLNQEFSDYGIRWIKWSRLNNTMQYDYMGLRDFPKPGNELLPPFGYCEVHESSKDVKTSMANKHKVLCELSQHILYQYLFIVLWFAYVIGMVLAIFGLIQLIIHYVMIYQRKNKSKVSFSHQEYLQLIKSTNRMKYVNVKEECSKIIHDFNVEAYL